MPSKFLIYGLVDPRDGQLRYVGKSCSGLNRPRQHWRPWALSKHEGEYKVNWIRQVLASDTQPRVVVIDSCLDREILSDAEIFWIAYFRRLGCRLTNATKGGDGRVGPCTWGDKIAEAKRGQRRSLESRSKQAASMMGKPSPNKGRVWTDEYRVKMSRACGGRPFADQFGVRYESLHDAARILGTSPGAIGNALKGRAKSAGGRVFGYVD